MKYPVSADCKVYIKLYCESKMRRLDMINRRQFKTSTTSAGHETGDPIGWRPKSSQRSLLILCNPTQNKIPLKSFQQ
jgi:hypothetical protein